MFRCGCRFAANQRCRNGNSGNVAENNTVNAALSSGLGGTPGIDTQRMQTEVLVPDGGTTVVGGVLTDLEINAKSKTPGLGDIPILKYLFQSKSAPRYERNFVLYHAAHL